MRNVPCFVVSAVSSNAGKTTVALGLMAALKARGLKVQAFKVGPDFLDPQHHECVTGRPSHNLDSWMCDRKTMLAIYDDACADADIAVVEGVMGLFDGACGTSEEGSAAQVAKLLGAPVLLVVDVSSMARSAAAVVLGVQAFDPEVDIAAAALNRVGGAGHAGFVKPAIEQRTGIPVIGSLTDDPAASLPSRDLGLASAREAAKAGVYDRLGQKIEAGLDVEKIIAIARGATRSGPCREPAAARQPAVAQARITIAVAKDEAFQFYYAYNLALLEAMGARLKFFSPLADNDIPDETDLIYLGGGYPELHANALWYNASMRATIKRFARDGGPIYAECGGFMYLAATLTPRGEEPVAMVGLYPADVRMEGRFVLGYGEVNVIGNHPFLPPGCRFRVHEFHYSRAVGRAPLRPSLTITGVDGVEHGDGFIQDNVAAGYAHVHFGACPQLAEGMIEAAHRYRLRRQRRL